MNWPTGTKIIDISHYQKAIQFHDVLSDGVAAVYLKASQSTGYTDPCYTDFSARAKSVGLVVGAYHFHDPNANPEAQALHFLSVALPSSGDMLPVLDVETMGPNVATNAIETAMAIKEHSGHFPILYASDSFYQATLKAIWPHEGTLWIARYGAAPVTSCSLVQFTDGAARAGMVGDSAVFGGVTCDADVLLSGDLTTITIP